LFTEIQAMPTQRKSYVSTIRDSAAAQKRRDVIDAAAHFLREEPSVAKFSLDAIAKRAGVTRLTVYNQFGSRSGLLEAVFDGIARRGGLSRLSDAISDPDPGLGLDRLVEIFCGFWSGDAAIGRLQDAGASDSEFGLAVQQRNERRRPCIREILQRIHPKQAPVLERDSVDLVFALTSYAVYRSLSIGRKAPSVCKLLKTACRDAARLPAVGKSRKSVAREAARFESPKR
jgi:AcrR family transcriptional regulator